jgi:hypothetical protein
VDETAPDRGGLKALLRYRPLVLLNLAMIIILLYMAMYVM